MGCDFRQVQLDFRLVSWYLYLMKEQYNAQYKGNATTEPSLFILLVNTGLTGEKRSQEPER